MLNRKTIEDIVATPWEDQDRELIDMYQQDTPDKIRFLKEAIEAADYKRMKQIAHDIKSASVSIGMSKLGQLLARFEQHVLKQDTAICLALFEVLEDRFNASKEIYSAIGSESSFRNIYVVSMVYMGHGTITQTILYIFT